MPLPDSNRTSRPPEAALSGQSSSALSIRTENVVEPLAGIDDSWGDHHNAAAVPDGAASDDDSSRNGIPQEEDSDDVTVILLDRSTDDRVGERATIDWIEQTGGTEMEERRRNVLIRELRRAQRASFFHFALLCLMPTVLLVIVIAAVLGDDEECNSEATFCELEPRTFINAFTTRCVCDPIPVDRDGL